MVILIFLLLCISLAYANTPDDDIYDQIEKLRNK